jgi:SAM-dependent methyltransferase
MHAEHGRLTATPITRGMGHLPQRNWGLKVMIDDSEWYSSGKYESVAISAQGGLAARIFHTQIERGLSRSHHIPRVLEVGALTGQHLPYVRHSFDTWTLTDIVDHPTGQFDDERIRFERQDVHQMTFADHAFDRIAATCVVHHLDKPIAALTEMRRVCRPGGVLTILLPVEPGWSYNMAIRLTSLRRAKKLGLKDEAVLSRAIGHQNHFDSLRTQFRAVFKHDTVKIHSWPLPFGGKHLNMFTSWNVIRSDHD